METTEKNTSRKLPSWMTKPKPDGLSIEKLQFPGSVLYSYDKCDAALLSDDFLTSAETNDCAIYIGFDMEWPVTRRPGMQDKTALIQICTSSSKCYLFHVSCMPGLPGPLREIINSSKIVKVGVNIKSDIWKLARDFDGIDAAVIVKESIVDLAQFANSVIGCQEKWSLDGLVRHLMHKHLDKDKSVREGDWSEYPLDERMQSYAALDAYASLLVYQELQTRSQSSRIH